MFTGIIEGQGIIAEWQQDEDKASLTVQTEPSFGEFEPGESIAVNGVCLTVVDPGPDRFRVDLSTETLSRTSFKRAAKGERVNLERALTPSKKMSGHFVQGHVDGVGTIESIEPRPGEVLFRFSHPEDMALYLIEKGSVAVDGISLTAFDCVNSAFTVSIIPFTLEHTNLSDRKAGDPVNLECDMIGKYAVKACQNLLGSKGLSGDHVMELFKKQDNN